MSNGKLFFCVLVTALTVNLTFSIVYEDLGNADDFFDKFLQQVFQEPTITKQMESLPIPNINQGSFQTWGGQVTGLKTLKRDGHCTYGISHQDKKLNRGPTAFLRAQMATDGIRFSMNYKVKILFITVSGVMEGKVGDMAAKANFHLNEKDGVQMDLFSIARFHGFAITRVSTNLSQSSWIMKMVANSIANKNKDQIVKALQNGMSDHLRGLLESIDLNDI